MNTRNPALRVPLLACLGGLLPLGGLSAQSSLVLPAQAAAVDGHQMTGVTLGMVAFRTQLLVDAAAIGPNGAFLNGIRLRGDRGSAPLAAVTVPNVTVTVSHTAVGSLTSTFVNHVTGATTTVFQGAVTLPAHAGAHAGPLPFDIVLPFVQPYTFLGAQGNLLIEIVGNNPPCFGICNPVYWLDSPCAGGSSTSFGRSGMLANGDAPILYARSGGTQDPLLLTIGNTIDFTTSLWMAPQPGLLALGLAPLPGPLDLTPLGAAGNTLWIDPIATVPHNWVTVFGYESSVSLAVPNQAALIGTVVFAQSALLDPAANALGLVLSAALEARIGDSAEVLPVQMLEAADPLATDGGVMPGCSLAVRLDGLFF
jgi:hypothetical protein